MPTLQRCSQGHTWEVPDGSAEPAYLTCPVCSTGTETPALRLESLENSTARRQHGPRPAHGHPADREPCRTVALHNDRTVTVAPPFGDRRTIALPIPTETEPADPATVTLPVDRGTEPPPALTPPLEPFAVPGYEIVRELGRGGMGIVYLARAVATERMVALKMILSGFGATDRDRQRFLREARAIAHLDHPSIVRVLEVGEVRGQPYFCLEYVAGGTLADHLRGVPQPPRAAASLLRTLARAMQTAHARGIVHRDLKPGNILLQASGAREGREPVAARLEPRIADFGLAKHLEGDGSRSGWIVGTPSYMAPEQAAGRTGAVGPPADVWALGAILYECLTGRPPFQGGTALDTLNLVQRGELVAPRQLNPAVPRDLETICLKCLRKEPGQRYGTMAELADDLERFLAGQPIRACRPSAAERCQRWIRHNLTLFFLLLTLGVTPLLLAVNSLWHSWSLQDALKRMEDANERFRHERDLGVRKQRDLEERDAQLHRYLYAATMQQAQHLWMQGDIRSMREILAPYQADADPSNGNSVDVAPRDFACRYLDGLPHGDLATLTGHRGAVYSVAWSPDGTQLVSGGKDGDLRFWDVPAGRAIRVVPAHRNEINAVAWGPDGQVVASASDDGAIGLWNATTGRAAGTLAAHGCPVVTLVFSSDGKSLYAGDDEGDLFRWTPGQEPVSLYGAREKGTKRIEQVVLSPDGCWLAAARGAEGVALLDLTGKTPLRVLATLPAKAQSVAFNPSGTTLAVGHTDGRVSLFDRATRKRSATLAGHTDVVAGLDFTPDGELLISAGQECGIGLWDTTTKQPRGFLRGHTGRIWCVAVAPNGRTIASASADGTIKLWNLAPRLDPTSLLDEILPCHALAVLPGVPLAIVGRARSIQFLSLTENLAQAGPQLASPGPVETLAVSPERRHVLASQGGGRVVLRDLSAGTSRLLMTAGRTNPPLAFSSDGRFAVVGDTDGTIRAWRMPAAEPVATAIKINAVIRSLAFQPGTHRLAVGAETGWVTLWELDGQKPLATWHAHQGDVNRIAFNSEGTVLATAGRDRVARLWDTVLHREIHHGLMGHSDAVVDVAFSPDGKLVATGTQGGVVRLWSVAIGRELLFLEQPGAVTGLGFVDNDRLLVAGNTPTAGYLRLYTAPPE